ncbi:ABC transporter permease [Glaciecola sp. MF2-115]|uniref:ABC transporter permease n=1 Tax=Glaciecola sp. MF2-115 TaxID=3384827 RepID=UPI0039A17A48
MSNRNMTALSTIWIKECTRFMRIWVQTLVPPAITMSLYFVIFGKLIGDRIGPIDGSSYMEFIVPGLIMMAVITNSYSNVSSSFFSAKFQRNVEEILVAPVPTWVVIFGFVGGGVARACIIGVIVIFVSTLFIDIQIANYAVIVATILLTSIMFSMAGLINGIYAKNFDDISIIPTFVLTPLTYLGGVFYSASMLEKVFNEFWQGVIQVNPIYHMVNAFRYGFLGSADVNYVVALIILVGFNIVLFAVAYRLLSKGTGIRS